ncbi:MAG: adenylate cyclase [Oscillospiraceae bacterium]|nr:adenylate cyclase [Oscillospiraceae bacterium]
MEIERKWLIRKEDIPFDLESLPNYHIEQRYISFHPSIRIRDINRGEKYILTVKTKAPENTDQDISRNEYETSITPEEYADLKELCRGNVILKRRYLKRDDYGLMLEIDLFEGKLSGLAYLEIEFSSETEANKYTDPPWVLREVTHVPDFKNAALAKNGMPGEIR